MHYATPREDVPICHALAVETLLQRLELCDRFAPALEPQRDGATRVDAVPIPVLAALEDETIAMDDVHLREETKKSLPPRATGRRCAALVALHQRMRGAPREVAARR